MEVIYSIFLALSIIWLLNYIYEIKLSNAFYASTCCTYLIMELDYVMYSYLALFFILLYCSLIAFKAYQLKDFNKLDGAISLGNLKQNILYLSLVIFLGCLVYYAIPTFGRIFFILLVYVGCFIINILASLYCKRVFD